ncbi:MAG: hypothetical protein AAF500_20215 [Myxococcota bacterium]
MDKKSLLILVACALTAACTKPTEPAESSSGTQEVVEASQTQEANPGTAPIAKAPVEVARPSVTVSSLGSAPRHIVRWRFAKGAAGTLTLAMEMDVEAQVDGNAQPSNPTPPIRTTLAVEVQDVTEEGTASIGVTVKSVGTDPDDAVPEALAERIRASLATMVGATGTYRCDSRGFVSDVALDGGAQAPPAVRQALENIRQSIRQMIAPLPEPAIGKGATWLVEADYPYSGILVSERATFTVDAIEPPKLGVNVSIAQQAADQSVQGGNGKSAELDSLSTKSEGVNEWNLDSPVPLRSTRDTKMSMTMQGPGTDGSAHVVTLEIHSVVALTGEAP